jgi:hypothetical protein
MSILPFDMGDLHFRDTRGFADDLIWGPALALGAANLRKILEGVERPEVTLCSTVRVDRKISDEWKAHRRANPNAEYSDFVKTFDPEYDDADCDASLPGIYFVVSEGRNVVGSWILYNVKEVSNTREHLEVTAYAAPGLVLEGREPSFIGELTVTMAQFLIRDLPMEDGRVFRLLEWEFPTDQEGHHWSGSRVWDEVSSRLQAAGLIRQDRTVGSKTTMKRLARA